MVNYDTDSSGGEDGDYTKTNVVLGYASEKPYDETSHLGGRPQWLDSTTPPSAALARCKVCRDMMVLLLQLNGDLPENFPDHERRLYVLACRRNTCRRKEGCVRVLRGVRITKAAKNDRREGGREKETTVKEERNVMASKGLGEGLFGVKTTAMAAGVNPFSSSTSGSRATNPFSSSSSPMPSNPFSASNLPPLSELASKAPQQPTAPSDLPQTFASVLSLNTPPQTFGPAPPPEPWPSQSELPKPYPHYYLEDGFETLDKPPDDIPIPHESMDIDDEGTSGSSSQKEDKDTYESTIDKTFQKFADRLAQNPEQVIRYEFKGLPLLYSKTDAVGKLLAPGHAQDSKVKVSGAGKMPRCGNCGAGRVFEVQLTPHAIMELEAEEMGLEGMEWGTVVVGVCERDCAPVGVAVGEAGYVEEWAGVQWEEEMKR